MIRFDDTNLKRNLASLRLQEEEVIAQKLAIHHNLPYINLHTVIISTDALSLVSEASARDAKLACYRSTGTKLDIATSSPNTPKLRAVAQTLETSGYTISFFIASPSSLEKAWERYGDIVQTKNTRNSFVDISDASLQSIVERVHTNADITRLVQEALDPDNERKVSDIIEITMGSAVATRSSDVHIEAQETTIRIRFRQDGLLEDVASVPHDLYKSILSRIKILAGLKISTVGNAQDGRFTIDYASKQIEIRVSTIPSPYGEGVVMRILDPDGIRVGLESLGIEPYLMSILQREIAKPNGLILNSGPTGSGKTTTLYSLLQHIYEPTLKVSTIEDPIEYHLDGIVQTPVNHSKGFGFGEGLRSLMRQDPDVILVGEIRDNETALAAMQAAQTGHLVLSTIHSNDAAGVLPRLLNLKIDAQTIAQAVTLTLAQRLVRKLTPAKRKVKPTPEQESLLRAILRDAQNHGKDLSRFGIDPEQEFFVYEPVPDETSQTGYKGRVGIFEAIIVNEAMSKLLTQNPNDHEVYNASQNQNILSLSQDAAIKIIQGVTSFDEVTRVVDLSAHLSSPHHESQESLVHSVVSNPSHSPSVVAPVESTNLSPANTSHVQQELALLIDYLNMLEDHQRNNPSVSIADKIEKTQDVITRILSQVPLLSIFTQRDNNKTVAREIDDVLAVLEQEKHRQQTHPHTSAHDSIRRARTTLQDLVV